MATPFQPLRRSQAVLIRRSHPAKIGFVQSIAWGTILVMKLAIAAACTLLFVFIANTSSEFRCASPHPVAWLPLAHTSSLAVAPAAHSRRKPPVALSRSLLRMSTLGQRLSAYYC